MIETIDSHTKTASCIFFFKGFVYFISYWCMPIGLINLVKHESFLFFQVTIVHLDDRCRSTYKFITFIDSELLGDGYPALVKLECGLNAH